MTKTVCYVVDGSPLCESALRIMKMVINCEINFDKTTNEVTIKCRHSDVAYVERVLSLYVQAPR